MKVFMSWSGQRSKLTAELLHDWIKCVIQAAQPWISSKGIERGALWFSEINNELKDTTVGIICLTQENKNAPWILFESGALAKGLSTNRVCTFLVDLQPAELQPPLAQFNHTFFTKESLWSLVTTLNNGLESNRLELPTLERVFDTYWPQFDADFRAILAENPPITVVAPRDEKDILAEILETTRSMSHRINALENTKASLLPRVVIPTAPIGIIGRPSDAENSGYAEGYRLATKFLQSGANHADIHMMLVNELGLGKKISKEIIETAIMATSANSVDKSSV